MSANTVERLRACLLALPAEEVSISDESHRHAGHAGASEGGHYQVRIVAAAFSGLNTLARHRLVHAAVGDLRAMGIHALAISALAPDEV